MITDVPILLVVFVMFLFSVAFALLSGSIETSRAIRKAKERRKEVEQLPPEEQLQHGIGFW